ncbi:MAG: hypothetical protein WC365_05765 [Candidatus Babeliales bacterium]|jgi:DNA-directed RNA polymerase subunit RPC12/RpoP
MKYTCCKCGKEFENNSKDMLAIFKFYGKMDCKECFDKVVGEAFGQCVVKNARKRSCSAVPGSED